MIKPHGADALNPLLVTDQDQLSKLQAEAETLPSMLLSSAAAANAVMLGGGYFTPLTGYMNLADALSVAEKMHTVDGLFWPVPVLNLADDTADVSRISADQEHLFVIHCAGCSTVPPHRMHQIVQTRRLPTRRRRATPRNLALRRRIVYTAFPARATPHRTSVHR